jgi:hypothetical protein
MPDHKLRIIGLAVETAAGREFVRLRRGPSRNDDDANVRPPVIHRSGERQAVYHSREGHVREEHLHFGTRIEDLQASSLLTASIARKPASTNNPTPEARTNASSSTIWIEPGARDE